MSSYRDCCHYRDAHRVHSHQTSLQYHDVATSEYGRYMVWYYAMADMEQKREAAMICVDTVSVALGRLR